MTTKLKNHAAHAIAFSIMQVQYACDAGAVIELPAAALPFVTARGLPLSPLPAEAPETTPDVSRAKAAKASKAGKPAEPPPFAGDVAHAEPQG